MGGGGRGGKVGKRWEGVLVHMLMSVFFVLLCLFFAGAAEGRR